MDRWLITYSDLITLLLIFFVIMYAMSKVDVAKFETLTESLAAALHSSNQVQMHNLGTTGLVVPANPTNQGDKTKTGMATPTDPALDQLYNEVRTYIETHHLQNNISIENQPRGVQITLRDVALFDTGQAVVRPDARMLLNGLVPFLQSLSNPILVEGYTDNVPIDTPQFPSNWELSAARAIDVVHFFANAGLAPERLAGVGYGQYHPVVPNTTPANRQLNRRVNIVILRDSTDLPLTSGPANSSQVATTPANSPQVGTTQANSVQIGITQ
ncbi:hypothetical protein D2Q93_07290 [Alicyclobacillaceae bacterium I2511]|nr:hypothetical protein D2Q93_07290 [Alicyclobacillaceae bacterium I2511]